MRAQLEQLVPELTREQERFLDCRDALERKLHRAPRVCELSVAYGVGRSGVEYHLRSLRLIGVLEPAEGKTGLVRRRRWVPVLGEVG